MEMTPTNTAAHIPCPACGLMRCIDQAVCDGVIHSRRKTKERAANLEAPTNTAAQVTPEMVLRASRAYREAINEGDGDLMAHHARALRAALSAALAGDGTDTTTIIGGREFQ